MTVSHSFSRRALLRVLGAALLLLLCNNQILQVQAIYPDGHFNYVHQIQDGDQLTSLISSTIDAGKTLFVRWIASPGWGWWRKQAPGWNHVTQVAKEQKNEDVVFADVNLKEAPIRGPPYNPGAGGWPTIRYFNAKTGPDGAPYEKKTDLPSKWRLVGFGSAWTVVWLLFLFR